MTAPGNPAQCLVGLPLEDGWQATSLLQRPAAATGGNFCVGYLAEHPSGRKGFVKALDFSSIFGTPDQAARLRDLTTMYEFEKDILVRCGQDKLSRVVVSVTDGIVEVPGHGPLSFVNYIVFERAEGDIRTQLAADSSYDLGLRLRCIHNVATGLKQLHQRSIVHQDLKPSNVLAFNTVEGMVSKVADLGRATDRNFPSQNDTYNIPGDGTYAPPEQLYGQFAAEFGERRIASDLYQLGSLAIFTFTAANLNALIHQFLLPQHSWINWTGSYQDVLPYVRDAYGVALRTVEEALPMEIQEGMMRVVRYLCDPEPARRGHPKTRQALHGNPYNLERVVTDLDVLCRRLGTARRRSA